MIIRKLTLQTKNGIISQAKYTDKENTGHELTLLGKSIHVVGLDTGQIQRIRVFIDNIPFRFLRKLNVNITTKNITYRMEYHELH